jgi:glycosyltransferase involved in cell wall biosynthesis/SAM-dependent methyltransferase
MTKRQRVLVVSTFPPRKCGIGTYAEEQVAWLKAQGTLVQTYTFEGDCGASYRLNTYSMSALLKGFLLFFFFRFRFDQLYVHYAADFFYPWLSFGGRKKVIVRLAQAAFLWWVGFWMGRRSNLIVHELSASPNHSAWNRRARGLALAAFHRIQFHTEKERQECLDFYPVVKRKRTQIVAHERFMQPKYFGNKQQARTQLGLASDQTIFVCLGFIQDHKGYDIAVEAMQALADPNKCLYIVGSVREPKPEFLAYRDRLAADVRQSTNITLVETFVSDQDFDCWIRAADCVILPYRHIQSSGVAARSLVLGTPMLINSGSNLANQLANMPGVTGFADTADLVSKLSAFDSQTHIPTSRSSHSDSSLAGIQSDAHLDALKPILFIIPWFGPRIKGGAEKFIYELATELVARGSRVEVWTTDSSELMGRNHTLTGSPEQNGDAAASFSIRRFPSNPRFEKIFNWAHGRMHRPKQGGLLTRWIWKRTALYGSGIRQALSAEHSKYATVHLCHYFSGTTHRLHDVAPEKTFLHAFVHDEPLAFSCVMRPVFSHPRGVLGNTEAEYTVAFRGPAAIPARFFAPIGNGIHFPSLESVQLPDSRGARKRKRQIVFVGRLIAEKGLGELVDWVDEMRATGALSSIKLVCIGEGPLKGYQGRGGGAQVEYRGWVSEQEKKQAIQESIALVLLSRLESFSFVIMESWLECTPVIVHQDCPATQQHVRKSSGGFIVGNKEQFRNAVDILDGDDALVGLLGASGMTYVRSRYSWDQVVENFHVARHRLMGWPSHSDSAALSVSELKSKSSDLQRLQVRWLSTVPNPVSAQGAALFAALDGAVDRSPPSESMRQLNQTLGADFYARFEDSFRGKKGATDLPQSWQFYQEVCRSLSPDTLWIDIGAGQGDLIQTLSTSCSRPLAQFLGVEPDTASFMAMRSRGIACTSCDGNSLLERLPAESVDVISLIQVAEHLELGTLVRLLELCSRALRPSGFLLIEWPCLFSIKTSAISYWQDPTHQRPVHPFALEFMAKQVGLNSTELRYFSPWQEELPPEYPEPLRIVWNDLYRSQDALLIARR